MTKNATRKVFLLSIFLSQGLFVTHVSSEERRGVYYRPPSDLAYRDNCPFIDGKTTWNEYLSGSNTPIMAVWLYVLKPTTQYGPNKLMPGFHEPAVLADAISGTVYTVRRVDGEWTSIGFSKEFSLRNAHIAASNNVRIMTSKEGDPRAMEFYLHGLIYKIDHAGFVYAPNLGWDGGYGLVGEATCHVVNNPK